MQTKRLAALEQEFPPWRAWVEVLRILAQSIGDPDWRDPVVDPEPGAQDAPLLDDRHVRMPAAALERLIERLAEATPDGAQIAADRLRAPSLLPLLQASISGTPDALEADRFATLTDAACTPLLAACAAQLADRIRPSWPHGWCPVCGARPVLAELIGLDRTRRLRCGRCGTGWQAAWLTCAFCGEADHSRLGTLVPSAASASEQAWRVDTCVACSGYLKSIAVLASGDLLDVMLADLESVALDIAARDQGFARPERAGHRVRVALSLLGPPR